MAIHFEKKLKFVILQYHETECISKVLTTLQCKKIETPIKTLLNSKLYSQVLQLQKNRDTNKNFIK